MDSETRRADLAAARRGDAAALGRLLDGFRPYLRMLVQAVRRHGLEARFGDSDLIQDTLLEAARDFVDFRGNAIAEFAGWLRRIAVRRVRRAFRDHLGAARRDAGRERSLDDAPEPAVGETPSAELLRLEESALLAEALERLPEDMRQVLLARHFEDVPYAELARRTGRSEGALRVLYTRALRRLRDELPASPPPE
jgi:RNA polymerase sigma-70 factor (ECF subfamily)